MTPKSPAAALAAGEVFHMAAKVRHSRLGELRNAFTYRADYMLFSPEAWQGAKGILRRNARGLLSLWDSDHGGPPKAGRGAAWAWQKLSSAGLDRQPDMVLGLLTQPRIFGFGFNPVSFWLLWQGDALLAVMAEVTNTWGQRHSYLCKMSDFAPLTSAKTPELHKQMHVSPFQDVGGCYRFRFGLTASYGDILICHKGPNAGLVARMQGDFLPLRQSALLASLIRRPGGALRVLALIYLQALRLKLRGATWRHLPAAPKRDFSE